MRLNKFPFFQQPDQMDCGATCLKMIAKFYGKSVGLKKLREYTETTKEGTSIANLAGGAERIGFRSLGVKINFDQLKEEAPLPAILYWQQNHFVIIYKVTKTKVFIADPAKGKLILSIKEFNKLWKQNQEFGFVLLLEPTAKLTDSDEFSKEVNGFKFLIKYIFLYKKFIIQLIIGLIIGSILQLFFPFLTQSIVDIGIFNQDLNFIYLILIAQLFLFFGKIMVEIIRGWILLHISTRLNISLLSDFFIKLMKLPISEFDSKMTGDILMRINDHQKIENILTNSSLNVLFSFFNIVLLGSVLAWYNIQVFTVFLFGSILYLLWVLIFLKRRRNIDYLKFNSLSQEQSKVLELINGMQEIKLNNSERYKRWEWELIQAKLFKIEIKNLKLEQVQINGSNIINELKNIFITVIAASNVISGEITLGVMLAITFIVGQLNSPIQQIIGFVYNFQDAKIALERLAEIHEKEDEESKDKSHIKNYVINQDIVLKDFSFRYRGANKNVLNNIDCVFEAKKITAIVGASGSGKTTLLKLLLKFYDSYTGQLEYGGIGLKKISHESWRKNCGVVMQEGFIFNDTIAKNIAIGAEDIDESQLLKAAEVANIIDFVHELPAGFDTLIGTEGLGLSTGQKQRILIARSVYKNPQIICFDEATSALDAKNERIIMENLNEFFVNRTAIVIAHRLSTVKNADKIIVLDKGSLLEIGNHKSLIEKRGAYYNLVKNQLELEKLDAKR